jgi:D-alanyl-D-alanine carboxypeptidase
VRVLLLVRVLVRGGRYRRHRVRVAVTAIIVVLAAGSLGFGAVRGAEAAASAADVAAAMLVAAEALAVAQAATLADEAASAAAAALVAAEVARVEALRPEPQAAPAAAPLPRPSPTPTPAPVTSGNPALDDPASITVVVNKARALGFAGYVPADLVRVPVAHTWAPLLRQEASTAVVTLFGAASTEAGLALTSNSAYRSYAVQQRLYSGFVSRSGQAYADTTSARAGHSEHQTGLALDIGAASGACSLSACFGDTAEGQWLVANAWRFGFLLRYPADKAAVTGFAYEPWHFRYVGVGLSTTMHDSGTRTLEKHFGLAEAPDYL